MCLRGEMSEYLKEDLDEILWRENKLNLLYI